MGEEDLDLASFAAAHSKYIDGLLVLLLHAGLALLHSGFSSRKSVASVLTTYLSCLCVSVLSYWLLGYGFAFGKGNEFIGE